MTSLAITNIRAMFLGLRNHLRRDDEVEQALDMCIFGGAAMMGLADYGMQPGQKADLVLLSGESWTEAVVSRPRDRLVLKRGKVIAEAGTVVFAVA